MSDSDSMKNKAQGTFEQAKGKVKETAGDLTDNESMQASGKVDQVKGKAREQFGDLEGKVNDLTDDEKKDHS